MLKNIQKNGLGTVSFDLMVKGMRKPAEFITYPIKEGDNAKRALIQSDKRIGYINLETGAIELAGPISGGAYFAHLGLRKHVGDLDAEDVLRLKTWIFASASGQNQDASMVKFDNTGALDVFS